MHGRIVHARHLANVASLHGDGGDYERTVDEEGGRAMKGRLLREFVIYETERLRKTASNNGKRRRVNDNLEHDLLRRDVSAVLGQVWVNLERIAHIVLSPILESPVGCLAAPPVDRVSI